MGRRASLSAQEQASISMPRYEPRLRANFYLLGLSMFAPNLKWPVGGKIEPLLQSLFFRAQSAVETEFGGMTIVRDFRRTSSRLSAVVGLRGAGTIKVESGNIRGRTGEEEAAAHALFRP